MEFKQETSKWFSVTITFAVVVLICQSTRLCIFISGGYLMRNFTRWAKQYEASKTGEIESMNKLMEWIPTHLPENERCTIVHGDFR
jgi:hypothetical protein